MNLPSDPKDMNDKRAEWAAAAIDAFEGVRRGDRENSLSDLLYNLMHWAERNDFDFNIELMRAEIHYHEQTTEDESEITPAQHLPYSGLAVAKEQL